MLPLANPMAVPDVGMKNNSFKRKIVIKTEPLSLWNEKRSIIAVSCLQSEQTCFYCCCFFKDCRKSFCLHWLCISGTQKLCMYKLVDLKAFPASSVWACPRLTSSHVAAKLKQQTKPLALPCTHVSQQWAETQISTSSFVLSPSGVID